MEDTLEMREGLKGLLLPPMWMLITGLVLNVAGVHDLPDFIEFPVNYLAAGVLPVVMLYAGLVLDWSGFADNWRTIAGVSVLKLALMPVITGVAVARLVIGPVVAFVIAILLGFGGPQLDTITVLGGMPSGMMVLVMGAHYRLPTDLLAGIVTVTTLFALLTLPIVTFLSL